MREPSSVPYDVTSGMPLNFSELQALTGDSNNHLG